MIAPANLQQHPLSAAFPAMQAEERQALRDSIEVSGVLNPITRYEDMVLDGWHRYCEAIDLGIDCPMVDLDTDGFDSDYPRDFVLAQNKHRRHITAAQLAMATTAVYKWRPAGRPVNCTLDVQYPKSSSEMAAIAGVHRNTIVQAQSVQTYAVPEVQAAVKNGEVGLPKAAAIAKLPKAEQAEALAKPLPKPAQALPDSEPEDTGPDADELAVQEAAEQADRQAMQLLLDSDDRLAAAVAEIKRLNAELTLLKQSRDAAMNRANELAKWVKKRDWQIAKLNEALNRGAA